MVRFFVTPEELSGACLSLAGENAQHAKVLRLKAGEEVLVCDGAGQDCLCRVMSAGDWELEILERRTSQTEASVQVSVYMAFPKADKLEHVIQKAQNWVFMKSWLFLLPDVYPSRMKKV